MTAPAWLVPVMLWVVGAATGSLLTHGLHDLWCRRRCVCPFCESLRGAGPR